MYKALFIFFGAFFGGVIAWILQKLSGVLSFEAGFLSFTFVFLGSFFTLNQRLRSIQPPSSQEEQEEQNSSFSTRFSIGLGISFSFLRILAYILLVLALLALLEYKFFNLYAYMIGIFLSGLLIVVLLGISLKF